MMMMMMVVVMMMMMILTPTSTRTLRRDGVKELRHLSCQHKEPVSVEAPATGREKHQEAFASKRSKGRIASKRS